MRRVKPNPANQLQRHLHAVEAERDTLRAERDAALARAEAAEAKVARVEALCALLDRVQLEQARGFWWDDDLDDNDLSLASSSEIRAALDGPAGGTDG